MQSKIVGIGFAALAALLVASPSFAQRVNPQPGAAPAQGGVVGRGIPSQQNAAPSGASRGAFIGGGNRQGGNRQGWNGGRRDGYRGGYRGGGFGGGVFFGAVPYYGAPSYAYDDDYYVDAPAAGGDVDYCIRRFRSYDVRSGTYLGNDGRRHACP